MPGPELEQGEIVELDEAVEMNPEPEQIDHDIVDAEHPPSFSWILKMMEETCCQLIEIIELQNSE